MITKQQNSFKKLTPFVLLRYYVVYVVYVYCAHSCWGSVITSSSSSSSRRRRRRLLPHLTGRQAKLQPALLCSALSWLTDCLRSTYLLPHLTPSAEQQQAASFHEQPSHHIHHIITALWYTSYDYLYCWKDFECEWTNVSYVSPKLFSNYQLYFIQKSCRNVVSDLLACLQGCVVWFAEKNWAFTDRLWNEKFLAKSSCFAFLFSSINHLCW